MSVILSCQAISKSYYSKELFSNLSFGVFDADRLAIIGPNGAGKSTLLRIMAGQEETDSGQLSLRRSARVAVIPQTQAFPDGTTVRSVLLEASQTIAADGLDTETRLEVLVGRVGFLDPDAPVASLSGGWKKRLSIACGLIQEPDLLLLDEPTNHLDFEGMLWLEKTLKSAPFAWAMVSHDRYFLDRTATKVAELNRIYPDGVFVSDGGYTSFLDKREEYVNQQARYEETLANKVRREVEWLRRGPQARATKAKYRIDEAHGLIAELHEVKSRARVSETKIDFSTSGRKTKKLIVADGVQKSLGDRQIVSQLDLVLTPGMNLGLIGSNGSGKTTLLKLLQKTLAGDRGEITHAEDLRVVYFDQNREQLNPAWTLKRALSDAGDAVIFQGRSIHVASWARRFNFQPEHLNVPVGELSGGEQARAMIARLMLQPADVLLLDEPTNDLDIPTLEVLEESLIDFPGALVLVTHDRYMLSRVCNIFLGLDGSGGSKLFADYEQWEKSLRPVPSQSKSATNKGAVVTERVRTTTKRLSYMEQREYDAMEEAILDAETELEACQSRAADPAIATASADLQAAYGALKAAQDKVDKLYARWAELEKKLH